MPNQTIPNRWLKPMMFFAFACLCFFPMYGQVNGVYTIDGATLPPNTINESSDTKPVISLYPNPTKGPIYINGLTQNTNPYKIYDAVGRMIQSGTVNNNILDLSNLSNGVYYIKVVACLKSGKE